jgi:general stress protein 26
MTSETEIRDRFWKELKAERTLMIGIDGAPGGGMQPMTALIEEDDGGPLWIFTSNETDLARSVGDGKPAHATFTGKKHDLFASITGQLVDDTSNRAAIDRLWNSWIAAWFEGGKDDPKLVLLRFDADNAKIWLNASSIGAAIEWLLRRDPKDSYRDKVAEVAL